MRAFKTLAIATTLAAIVATTATAKSTADVIREANVAAGQQLRQSYSQAPAQLAQKLTSVKHAAGRVERLRKTATKSRRFFQAKQAATCDQAGFAEATARVLQACPSLSGLVSGSTSLEEFLPGFCGSECYNALSEELVRHSACVDEDTEFLLEFVWTCQNRPQCFSEGFVSASVRVEAQCSSQIAAVMDITNFTNAAQADAQAFCSGSCRTDMTTLLSRYPECLGDDASEGAAMVGAMNHMCTSESGELCAVRLKTFGALQCDSPSICQASTLCSASCQPALTTANLDRVCGTCLSGLIPYLTAFGEDPTSMNLGLNLYCMKAGTGPASDTNPYCYGPVMTVFASSQGSSGPTAASACATAGVAKCYPKMVTLIGQSMASSARTAFPVCVNQSVSFRTGCVTQLESALLQANMIEVSGDLFCAQNAANAYCYDTATTFSTAAIGCSMGCSSCASQTEVEASVASQGCCLPKVNRFLRPVYHLAFQGNSMDVPDVIFPAGNRPVNYRGSVIWTYTHTPLYARSRLNRGDQPVNAMFGCSGNASTLWATAETRCPTTLPASELPSGSIPVTLSFDAVNADPARKMRLEASLTNDVADNAGLTPSQVVNGTIVRGSGSVQTRAGASASTRRQTTGSNCEFQYKVDAATAAEAQAAVAAVNTKVSAGTLATPSTAVAVKECQECLDARQNSLVSAAAPAPGASPSTPASSASGVATAAAVAVAAALALVL